MCCRYYFDDVTFRDVERIVDENNEGLRPGLDYGVGSVSGDVHPMDEAVVIVSESNAAGKLCARNMRWGFAGADKQLLINARAESALEKRTFRDSVMFRRCIVPAKHFYEWDSRKNKNIFRLEDCKGFDGSEIARRSLYMAGCYTLIQNELRFVVLTTGANASMLPVHDRMPLILSEAQIGDWIMSEDLELVKEMLGQQSPMLRREQEYEQLSLFDL